METRKGYHLCLFFLRLIAFNAGAEIFEVGDPIYRPDLTICIIDPLAHISQFKGKLTKFFHFFAGGFDHFIQAEAPVQTVGNDVSQLNGCSQIRMDKEGFGDDTRLGLRWRRKP